MTQITVDSVTFHNPDYTPSAFHQLQLQDLVAHILTINPMVPRNSLRRGVIMGSYEHLTASMRAKVIASGHQPSKDHIASKRLRHVSTPIPLIRPILISIVAISHILEDPAPP